MSVLPIGSALAAGTIQGVKWDDLNGDGVRDAGEPGVGGVTICLDGDFTGGGNGGEGGIEVLREGRGFCGDGITAITAADGSYAFSDVAAGAHVVHEVLPGLSTNTTPLSQIVDLADGETEVVDFGNKQALPPPPEVTIEGASPYTHEGLPVVFFGAPSTYRKDVIGHCGGATPVAIRLVIGPFADTGNTRDMAMTLVGGSIWEAAFPPFIPDHGTAALRFYVDCAPDTPGFPENIAAAAGEDEFQDGGNIYVDPSGRILNACTSEPLEDAEVTILHDVAGNFETAPASTPPLIPPVNPQTTGADGRYGWVVTPGTYRVHAEKAGFSAAESADLVIPPAVTDLDLLLTPDEGCPPVPTSKDQCKNGGWRGVFRADGTAFKNQGDCIQYVNTGR
jgi:hypothetical protein